ncbi:hypothetical protein CERSUDRAFT_99576 [Gelatoporia subvermispora B]|uniref:Uncharacterized protein n=1 Tax=Ceriporiopsis subvermispora (strain B) TaxID=914234 RepID=M2QJ78_CERS8|nr:hypothetical protein CERSUDRAFT_99576 [Gelatoporia subvermispora B]
MPPSYSPCPRPILKRPTASSSSPTHAPLSPTLPADGPAALLAIDPSILSPHSLVHFAPRPALAVVARTHSAAQYDRSPIVVQPNRCALPERGCPGRTYSLADEPSPSSPPPHTRRTVSAPAPAAAPAASTPCRRRPARSPPRARSPARGRHLHPRAGVQLAWEEYTDAADDAPSNAHAPVPPLVPDLSSSDESDGIASPPAPAPGTLTAGLEKALELETSLAALALHSAHPSSNAAAGASPGGGSTPNAISAGPAARTSFLPHPHLHQQQQRPASRSPSRARTPSGSPVPPAVCPSPPAASVYTPATPSSLSPREPQKRVRRKDREGREGRDAREPSARYKAYLERSARAAFDDGGCLGGF